MKVVMAVCPKLGIVNMDDMTTKSRKDNSGVILDFMNVMIGVEEMVPRIGMKILIITTLKTQGILSQYSYSYNCDVKISIGICSK